MSWTMPKPDEILISEPEGKSFDLLPKGKYTLSLLPGSAIDEGRGRLNINVGVAEGEFKGRRLFPSLPLPTQAPGGDWPNQVIRKLSLVLGTDFNEGESPADYLNRVANNGHSRFTDNVYTRTYTNKKTGAIGTETRMAFQFGVAA